MISRQYNRKIEIWRKEFTTDEYGGPISTDILIRSVWARINTSAGNKFADFGIQDFKNPVIFSVRDVKNKIEYNENTYVKYKGSSFFIRGVQHVGLEGIELDLLTDSDLGNGFIKPER